MNVQSPATYTADAAPGADLLATAETLGQRFAARAANIEWEGVSNYRVADANR